MRKGHWFTYILLVFIITVPSFLSLLNSQYFSMHDDQHIARLHLLDTAIHQGYVYPRWVDRLGFGFGYPLFNFYPPFIYYVAEAFKMMGFSLVWSMKLVVITGFTVGAVGMFLLMRRVLNTPIGVAASALYTYFTYHAVVAYVRGALAEFFSMAVLPFIFLTLYNLYKAPSALSSLGFGFTFALLILTHPLVAFPALFFIGAVGLYYFMVTSQKKSFLVWSVIGAFEGLGLSAFFWLPSMIEKQYTYVDEILTHELANYKLHYIYPQQLWQSIWGYGGSISGPNDGMSLQIGKVQIIVAALAFIAGLSIILRNKVEKRIQHVFIWSLTLLGFSIYMTTEYSSVVWDTVHYLWYLQFPWRFLTFTAVFIAIFGSTSLFFLSTFFPEKKRMVVQWVLCAVVVISVIGIYGKYFKPQYLRNVTDADLTTKDEIEWRISKTSFEFVPKGVVTKKTDLDTTTLAIEATDIPMQSLQVLEGSVAMTPIRNTFEDKVFYINSNGTSTLRLNTYMFPGWKAILHDGSGSKQLSIDNKNAFKLITVSVPGGEHDLEFAYEGTSVQKLGNMLSLFAAVSSALLLFKFQKKKS